VTKQYTIVQGGSLLFLLKDMYCGGIVVKSALVIVCIWLMRDFAIYLFYGVTSRIMVSFCFESPYNLLRELCNFIGVSVLT